MPLVRNILGAIRSAWSNRSKAAKRSRRHMLNGVDQLDPDQVLNSSQAEQRSSRTFRQPYRRSSQ